MGIKIPSINRVQIAGRITKDLELKRIPSGTAVVGFSVACDRGYKDKDGTWQKETVFVPMQAWGALAETIAKHGKKGSPVLCEGRYNVRKYQNKDGQDVTLTEVVLESCHLLEWPEKDGLPEVPPTLGRNDEVPF